MDKMTWSEPEWRVVQELNGSIQVYSGNISICELWRRGETKREFQQAALMASAPDLLIALQDLLPLAQQAMREANRDGADYDIDAESGDAIRAINKAHGIDH